MISVIFAIIPFCYNVLILAIAMAVTGLAMGVIDTIANIQLVAIYQKDSAVFLQVCLHCHNVTYGFNVIHFIWKSLPTVSKYRPFPNSIT